MEHKMKYYTPLIIFLIPTIIISIFLFIFTTADVITIIGFIILLIGACGSYYMGLKAVYDDIKWDLFIKNFFLILFFMYDLN